MSINTATPFTCNPGTINGREVARGYMAEADDARELAAFDDRLTEAQYRTLQAAIGSGLPVVLTIREPGERPAARKVTAIVEYATIFPRNADDPTAGSGNLIRVRYWGFGHNVWLQDIIDLDTPEVEFIDLPE
ncbi:hypothetical protein SEA_ROSMARINUS_39 [Mycobacterium Phage Rosmarinus]|nr:hypothetical protein SEA_CREW_39 [Mycobacterium phage CREW]ASR86872.1 hypothetical protein SEA_JECKYLL_39 [Mycobacterium phage Jeckyll]AXH50008.1 hypothetical protein SEA_HOMURA_39 [Mycobacterium phage Homura]AXH50102.1 hypothetical protein SEA_JOY99_39 [Mycobacterium phage Joy99]AXQ51556.1 hypothetical protein SEA_BELLADONNA_39 [Mycobacterium phage Belladonna]AYB68897.1 hypothetical protein SEA_DALMURI_39 [Mycobacterium phage Dalmuri]AZF97476.1 hypothetical protein SEA_CAPRICORN_39 [Mycob